MDNKIVVGIDISKDFANAAAVSSDGEILLETKVFYDKVGLEHFRKILSQSAKECRRLTIVMESTAHYHRILEQFLRNKGYEVILINPLQASMMKTMGIRKVKNDKFDALGLAKLYLLGMLKPNNVDTSILGSLKDLSRQRADIIGERKKFTNKLTALLDQAFPGFFKVFASPKVRSALGVLKAFPTPESVLAARKMAVRKAIAFECGRASTSVYVKKKADLLIAQAKEALSVCIKRDSFLTLIPLYAEMILSLQNTADQIESDLYVLAQSNASIWHYVELLTSIPGIGYYSAVVIIAEIGDFSRFTKPKQLIAYAGLDPEVKQSGKSLAVHNKITKRGSPYLRNILDTCTHVAAHRVLKTGPINPVLNNYYKEKRKSKPAKVVQCACMHKMLGYIYAVLRDQKPFLTRDPEKHLEIIRSRCNSTAAA